MSVPFPDPVQTPVKPPATGTASLSRNECLAAIYDFMPPSDPIYIADRGIWQADGWYYFLWENKRYKALLVSTHTDNTRYRYYVKHWPADNPPSRHDIVRTIREHAKGLKDATLRHGVVTERGATYKNRIWSTDDLEIEVPADGDSLYLTHLTHGDKKGPAMPAGRFMQSLQGVHHPLQAGPSSADLEIMKQFYEFLGDTWKGDNIHDEMGAWYRRAAVFVVRNTQELHDQRKPSTQRAVRAGFFLWGVLSIVTASTLNPISLPKTIYSAYRDGRAALAKRKDHGFSGQPPANTGMRGVAPASDYIRPFSFYYRPVAFSMLQTGRYVQAPDFGKAGLFPVYSAVPALEDAELSRIARPNRAALAEFFYHKNVPATAPAKARIGAVRFYRPDGVIVTLTGDTAWFSQYESWHVFEKSSAVSERLAAAFKTSAVLVTHNLLAGLDGLAPAPMSDLDAEFMAKYGVPFYRRSILSRQAPALER